MRATSAKKGNRFNGETPPLRLQEPDVELVVPRPRVPRTEVFWERTAPAAQNYAQVGRALAKTGTVFAPAEPGSLIVIQPIGTVTMVETAIQLFAAIADRLDILVLRAGKPTSNRIPSGDLQSMLVSDSFRTEFPTVDTASSMPIYLPDFTLAPFGYTDAGPGCRVLFSGPVPLLVTTRQRIDNFLDTMQFATPADRTNALAGALTVKLRHQWPGGKPIVLVTSTKSHGGKDTVIRFASGLSGQHSVSYEIQDWALQHNLFNVLKTYPERGVVVIENAKSGRTGASISSSIIERLATDPEPLLAAPGTGRPQRRRNDFVLAISTNEGSVSEDIMNRSLPIHLHPLGDIYDRHSKIGNPKLEYLPWYAVEIDAELHGMIAQWREAGQPLDDAVRHPCSAWVRTVGGILKFHGYLDFLTNYGSRRICGDPVRQALGIMGAARPDVWLRPEAWACQCERSGLSKALIPRSTGPEARRRDLGVVLSHHADETFITESDTVRLTLRLVKARRRFDAVEPHVRYCFEVVDAQPLVSDEES